MFNMETEKKETLLLFMVTVAKRKKKCFISNKNLVHSNYNDGHNILRLIDTIPNFLFTASEAKRDY